MRPLQSAVILLLLTALAAGQSQPPKDNPPPAASGISGMYTFLRDGEFVQIDVDGDKVDGFISRYGDRDSDRGTFLDHMIKTGTLDGKKLHFDTRAVHGVSFEFTGTVERGEGKAPGDEAYYVLKGTLKQITEDADHKPTAKERAVEFKSFPADAGMDQPKKKDF